MEGITFKADTSDSNIKAYIIAKGPLNTVRYILKYSPKNGKHYLNNPFEINEHLKGYKFPNGVVNKSGRKDQAWPSTKEIGEQIKLFVMHKLGLEDKNEVAE